MIQNITVDFVGEVGVYPRLCRLQTDDSYAVVTAAGYINNNLESQIMLQQGDFVFCNYGASITPELFVVSINAGIITLIPYAATTILPVSANHIACFANAQGTLTDDAAPAINGGDIQAGLSGTAGALVSYPATAAKGSLKVVGVANTGDTVTTISNVAMGQASVISIPDPAGATAHFVVAPAALAAGNAVKASGTGGLIVDAGYAILAKTTASYAGGGTSNAFAATGLTTASIVVASILASTNAVSIVKVVPTTNTLTVTFSADPGAATTVNYIATTAAV